MRSLFLAVLLVSALLPLSACAPEGELGDVNADEMPVPPLHFNITLLAPEFQVAAEEGSEDWNSGAGHSLIVIDPHGEHSIQPKKITGTGSDSVSFVDGIVIILFDDRGTSPECARFFFAHAFGHALQSRWNNADPYHSAHPEDLMFPAVGCHAQLTNADLASLPW